jgi:hypothetical protein
MTAVLQAADSKIADWADLGLISLITGVIDHAFVACILRSFLTDLAECAKPPGIAGGMRSTRRPRRMTGRWSPSFADYIDLRTALPWTDDDDDDATGHGWADVCGGAGGAGDGNRTRVASLED